MEYETGVRLDRIEEKLDYLINIMTEEVEEDGRTEGKPTKTEKEYSQ